MDDNYDCLIKLNKNSLNRGIKSVLHLLEGMQEIRGLPFIFRDLASLVLPTDKSIVKLDIFEVIHTQNVLTYERSLCCLQ